MLGRTYQLGTFAGIPVKLHWSFGLLVLTLLFLEYRDHQSLSGVGYMAIYISILFLCVVLHEYGHALTARRYGIRTKDIILSPIGGLARLEDIPEQPIREFMIAIAGPLVNLVIAISLAIFMVLSQVPLMPDFVAISDLYNPTGLLALVFWMNVVLFIFNLIPAFPMDGGRILRALLSTRLDRVVATKVSMYIARALAILGFGYAIYSGEFVLTLISAFIFYSAGAEYQNILLKHKLSNTDVASIMRSAFTKVSLDHTYADLVNTFKSTGENNYLVYEDNQIIGTVPSVYLADHIKNNTSLAVRQQYRKGYELVNGDMKLLHLYDQMQDQNLSIVGVINGDHEVVGVLDRHLFTAWMNTTSKASILDRLKSKRS